MVKITKNREEQFENLSNQHCPLCKANLKLVEGVKNGEKYSFWGCSRFPYCHFSISRQKLEEWVRNDKKSDDSFLIFAEYGMELSDKKAKLLNKLIKINDDIGFVYFVRERNGNLIKIGKTKNLLNRLGQLNTEMSGIVPIWIIKTKFYSAMEKFFHELFNRFLVEKNEYFEIPPEYLIEITKIKKFLGCDVEIIDKFNDIIAEFIEERHKIRIENQIKDAIDTGDVKRKEYWKKEYAKYQYSGAEIAIKNGTIKKLKGE